MEGKDITNAKCEFCNKIVEAKANISGSYDSKDKITKVYNQIYTYWSCKSHGSVGAYIDGEYYDKPSDLFKEIELENLKDKINIKL